MAATREDIPAEDAATVLAQLAGDVAALELATQDLPPAQQALVTGLKGAIEALHREALLRLVRGLRTDAAAAARLKDLVRDPVIFGVLRLHGLVRDPLELRVREALATVEPLLAQHGGGVELVAVIPPDTVQVRLTGACQGCPASGQTLRDGVERALREHVPEIRHVRHGGGSPALAPVTGPVPHRVSPFARTPDGFTDVCALHELPPGSLQARRVAGREVLLHRTIDAHPAGQGGAAQIDTVSCVDNACAHLGMPLADGEVADGVVTCPHHGFRYRLDTGECLTLPQVQLVVHPVRVQAGRIAVKLDG